MKPADIRSVTLESVLLVYTAQTSASSPVEHMKEEAARIVTSAHPRPEEEAPPRVGRHWVFFIVLLIAIVLDLIVLASTHLWVLPDSSYYIALGGGIADQSNFSNEHFLIRPPGYPLLLAGVFRVFGERSPIVLQVVQHAMHVGIVALIAATAWELTRRRSMMLLAGILTAVSPQLLAFADVIMPEMPYALCLAAAAYFLIRYYRFGRPRVLAAASLMVGMSYLFRPMGISLLAGCAMAWLIVCTRSLRRERQTAEVRSWLRRAAEKFNFSSSRPKRSSARQVRTAITRVGGHALSGVLPCALVVAPVLVHNHMTFGRNTIDRCAKLALYYRLLVMDELDAPDSEALKEIKETVATAKWRGAVSPYADFRQWGPVVTAYKRVKNMGLGESAGIIGQAATDVFRAHRDQVLENTGRYAWWMMLRPDSTYRFLPRGAPGRINERGESVRDPEAVVYDIATYRPMLAGWINPYESYLPLADGRKQLTPSWEMYVRAYHDYIEAGVPPLGIGDTAYEELGLICLVGLVVALLLPGRGGWVLILVLLGSQIVPSAFLAGPTPRYAVPLIPFFLLGGASLLASPFTFRRVAGDAPVPAAAPALES